MPAGVISFPGGVSLTFLPGSLCGSVFHDQRFEEYIRHILGDKMIDAMKVSKLQGTPLVTYYRLLKILQPRSKEGMMRSWEETVKFKVGSILPHSDDSTRLTIDDQNIRSSATRYRLGNSKSSFRG